MGDLSNLGLSWRTVMMAMICMPILVSALILLRKKVETAASRTLAAVLMVSVLAVTPQIIGFAGFYQVWPQLTFFPFVSDWWLGPLIYLHAHLLLKQQALSWRLWLLLPGVVQSIYYTCAFLFLGDYQAKWAFSAAFHSPYILPIESVVGILMLALAFYKIWKMYNQYEAYIYNTESIAVEFEPIWLKRIIQILMIAGGLFCIVEVTGLFVDISYATAFPLQVIIMLSIAWLSIEAVWRINQSFPKLPIHEAVIATDTNDGDIDREVNLLAAKINEAVLTNQWFLQPRFSLKDLAQHIGSNEVYVSKAINQGLNQSYNDFVNSLRVAFAQDMLRNTALPLLHIALDSGFNSKATFNRVFKGISGETPSQYRKQKSLKS